MRETSDEASRRKIVGLVEHIDYAVLGTRGIDGGPAHARPMAYRSAEPDGDFWFLTKGDSRKVEELRADPETLLSFADPKNQVFVTVTGTSEVLTDRETVRKLWTEIYRTWFPGGPDDPNIVGIRVRAEHAEYWDTPSSAMIYAYGYVKAVVTGKPAKPGDVGAVLFE